MGAFLTAVGLVFVAELGDRTQLLVVTLGRLTLRTVVGLAVVLTAVQGLGAVAGATVARLVPTMVLGLASGLLFLGFAVWTWRSPVGDDDAPSDRGPGLAPLLLGMGLAELGDKSNLAVGALATRGDAVATWLGGSLGLFLATMLALAAGDVLRRRLGADRLRRLGAVAFAVTGVATLVGTFLAA